MARDIRTLSASEKMEMDQAEVFIETGLAMWNSYVDRGGIASNREDVDFLLRTAGYFLMAYEMVIGLDVLDNSGRSVILRYLDDAANAYQYWRRKLGLD